MPRGPEVVGVDLAMPHLWPQVLRIEEVSCKAQSRISKGMHAWLWDETVRIRCEGSYQKSCGARTPFWCQHCGMHVTPI